MVRIRASGLALAIVAVAFAATAAAAAENNLVLSVPEAARVVVQYKSLPVSLALAHLEVPDEFRASCQERLKSLVLDRQVEVLYVPGFGLDANGSARVQLVSGGANVNEALVEAGFAKFQAGAKPEPLFEDKIKQAQDKAEKNKSGLWGKAPAAAKPAEPTVAAAPKAPAAPTAPSADRPKGPFASELNNKYYYPSDSSAIANVNPQRLIYYPDEAAAKRAGKIAKPKIDDDIPSDGSLGSADAIFAKGRDIYADAQAHGNTSDRDVLYEKAYVQLTKAMQIYGDLVEKKPNDEALAEKLRVCMQLRYGSVKQRRVDH